ncbi:helix-turn-helix domain-containing protein [Phenylobacterium sp. LjRoot219]|uniref:helix-turn-helix domain-containing protein n=1 Tax=Phenylobacterium sp. LjRoot219 TaxID=3342283 RepID=UPI003ECF797C
MNQFGRLSPETGLEPSGQTAALGGGADSPEALQGLRPGSQRPRDRGKVRSARRVVELLTLLADVGYGVTVGDVCEGLGWPQSSASELLQSLVEMGLLYKSDGRRYSPTPLAASLGCGAQPLMVRSGRLQRAMEILAWHTGYSTAVIGRVGLDAQVFGWVRGGRRDGLELRTGMKAPLHETAAGWLLLSALDDGLIARTLHRLLAEAPPSRKFDVQRVRSQIATSVAGGRVSGPGGFAPQSRLWAARVRNAAVGLPLALAIFHPPDSKPDLGLVSSLESLEDLLEP